MRRRSDFVYVAKSALVVGLDAFAAVIFVSLDHQIRIQLDRISTLTVFVELVK